MKPFKALRAKWDIATPTRVACLAATNLCFDSAVPDVSCTTDVKAIFRVIIYV